MKRLTLALFFLSVLVLSAVFVVNSLTTGMAKTADEFLMAVSEDRVDTAMNYLSTGFRNAVTPDEFQAYVHAVGLNRYKTTAWDSRAYSASQGEIDGAVYLDDGSVQPLKLVFVQEEDEWRIQTIEATLPGISQRQTDKAIPALPALERMVMETMTLFGTCVATDDFDPFQEQISALWQSRTSPARLRKAFAAFIENQVDISLYAQVGPVFSEPPYIDGDGVMRLTGYFPHEAGTLNFDLSFTFEYPEWKLLGLNVRL